MTTPCPEVPPVESAKTPKERTGLKNAHKFRTYILSGLKSNTLPLHNGVLHRSKARYMGAETEQFCRSAFIQNEWIKNIANWADMMLGGAVQIDNGSRGKTEIDRQLLQENQRLKERNVALKVELADAQKKLREIGYMEKAIESGDARLPW